MKVKSKKLWLIAVVCVAVLLVAVGVLAVLWGINQYTVKVVLHGETDIILEYGQTYEETGASATFSGTRWHRTPKEIAVTVSDTVDTSNVGTYWVRYTAQCWGCVGTAYRKVQVVDTQAPEISLVANPEYYTLPTESYVEEGFSASDGYDGDLTHRVKRMESAESVTYFVSDSSGNTASVTRQIVYDDPIPPQLELKEGFFVVSYGEDFQEPGYTATDNCDGDITDWVKVSGSVNTFRTGKYYLTYSVKDTYENAVSVTRTVFVKDRDVDKINDPGNTEKVIYLTFDDGPGSETPRLLNILAKYNVQASFFVVNTKYIDTITRAAEEGHTIAIHTNTHRYKEIYASEDAFFEDLYAIRRVIAEYTGQEATLMRFPGGSSNTISDFNEGIMTRLTKAVEEKGFTYFDWNVDSDDAGRARTPARVYQNVVSGIGDKTEAVVLMHDIKSYTVDAIEKIIVWGLDNGYTFLPLTADSPGCHHGINN